MQLIQVFDVSVVGLFINNDIFLIAIVIFEKYKKVPGKSKENNRITFWWKLTKFQQIFCRKVARYNRFSDIQHRY